MDSQYIYAVVKRGKFFKGQDYCTGHKSKASWTENPRQAAVMRKDRAERVAHEFGGKVAPLAHLQPQVGQRLFRLENDLLWDGDGGMKISVSTFQVERRTPKGVWVRRMWPSATTGVLQVGFGAKRHFILDGQGRRHAYALMEDALESFKVRKQRQLDHLESQLLRTKAAIEIMARPDFEIEKTYYLESLRQFREY